MSGLVVRRATRLSWTGAGLAIPAVLLLAAVPYLLDRGIQQNLVSLFSLVVIATMWNLMAGYGGMVSIGQQCYIGIGAYGLVYCSDVLGIDPFLAVPVAALVAGLISIPISFVAFRLAGGYFAICTWVIAEVVKLVVMQIDQLGGGSGITLRAYVDYSPAIRVASIYWLSLAGVVLAVALTYLLMRSRIGLGFTAVRDDPIAASALGVDVTRSKRIVFVVASMGTALAGAMIASNTLRVQPDAVFSVQYSAYALFIVVIGGLGTIEGPIVGSVVFWVLQQELADLGTWYMVILGLVAIVVVLFLPGGIWGLVSRGGAYKLFPVGYRLLGGPSTPSRPQTEVVPEHSGRSPATP